MTQGFDFYCLSEERSDEESHFIVKQKERLPEISGNCSLSISKPIFIFFAANSRIFVFLATCAAEKLLISENR